MKKILNFFIFLLLIVSPVLGADLPVTHGGSPYIKFDQLKTDQIAHIPTGTIVTLDQMLDDISNSRVIYVGETHDNTESHRVQLEMLKQMEKKFPGQISVGMEMFRKTAQKDLDLWIKGDLPHTEFLKLWKINWGDGYESYQAILDFIKEKKIPLIGLKPSKEDEKIIHTKGLNHLTEADKKIISLPEIDESDPFHKEYAMAIFGGHGKDLSRLIFPYQMLLFWEETMADSIANFLKSKRGENSKMIVFAGGFHVEYGFGIPKRTYRRIPHAYSTIISVAPYVPEELADRVMMDVNPPELPLILGDYAWLIEYKVLPKTKPRLGVSINPEEKGLKILLITKSSLAEQAGILIDDYILAMDDVVLKSSEELIVLLQKKKAGEKAKFKILRQEKELLLDVEFKN